MLNIDKNRSASKYSFNILLKRILWSFVKCLFHFSPRIAFSWRNFLLRLFGAKIGKHVHIYNSAEVYMPWNLEIGDWSAIGEYAYIYNLDLISIGSRATISQRAHLCAGTHDYEDSSLPLITKPITIQDNSWVCADAFIGPGVTIHEGAVIGARAVITKDVEAHAIMAGNPAKKIKSRNITQQN